MATLPTAMTWLRTSMPSSRRRGFGERADSNASRRFAGGSALQNVACLRKIVFQRPRQVGVTRAGRRHALMAGGVALAHRQRLLPIFPVSVFQLDRNRRTYRHAVTDAGKNVRGVTLDLHAAAAAIALLPAPEFPVEKCLVHFEPGRQARKESDQSFAVRLSSCEVAQHKCSILPDDAATWSCRTRKHAPLFRDILKKIRPVTDFHLHGSAMIATINSIRSVVD